MFEINIVFQYGDNCTSRSVDEVVNVSLVACRKGCTQWYPCNTQITMVVISMSQQWSCANVQTRNYVCTVIGLNPFHFVSYCQIFTLVELACFSYLSVSLYHCIQGSWSTDALATNVVRPSAGAVLTTKLYRIFSKFCKPLMISKTFLMISELFFQNGQRNLVKSFDTCSVKWGWHVKQEVWFH